MRAVIVFFGLGVILLALEIVAPGAVLGIAGGVCMFIGVAVAFAVFGGTGGAVASSAALLALGATLYLEFVWLPRSRLVKKFSMDTTNPGASQPPLAQEHEVVGREATAQTKLAPTGYVQVEGRRYEAFSQSGFAEAGTRLRVVAVDNFRLIVTKT